MPPDSAIQQGRIAFDRQLWLDAYASLSAADRVAPLEPEDLQRLATAAFLIGRDEASDEAQVRAHAGFLERGDLVRAVRSGFWHAHALLARPTQRAQGNGWVARIRRLIDDCGQECAEQGLVLCAEAFQRMIQGDMRGAFALFEQAAAVGARFHDPDVTALASHGKARGLIRMQRAAEGFALLDEVMVSVAGGEIGPVVSGIVYCSVISACYDAFDIHRAQEWTTALSRWCAAHPDMVAFRGQCLVRRSELMQLHGGWNDATVEAQRACETFAGAATESDAAAAYYQQGEMHRLRGDFASADEWYRRATQAGRNPYPGLALLRLAQGQSEAADAAARRMLLETRDPRARARMLGAAVEIFLARQDLAAARAAAEELTRSAGEFNAPILQAAAWQAEGNIALAANDVAAALEIFRKSLAAWQELDAPYEMARVRAGIGLVYRRMGDEYGAQMEFDAAQETFDRLGAAPDSTRVASFVTDTAPPAAGPLTGREVEVLRLVATGKTNRMIAAELAISEKTVARHLSNIFTKLDLPSRAAATAYVYEHKLL